MKKFLSILLVLMLAVLPAMAEQTGIQAERNVTTVEVASAVLGDLSLKFVVDVQEGEYPHLLETVALNGEELTSDGFMLDEDAKQLFVSVPMACDNVLVFDEEDLTKVINMVGNALVEVLNELKNDPEFIATMAELDEALAEGLEQAMGAMAAEQVEQAKLEAVLNTLNYDKLAKELEAIFTPVQSEVASADGNTFTEYSFTVNKEVMDKALDAVAAFFAENKEALGEYAIDEEVMAQFKQIMGELMSAISVTSTTGADEKGTLLYINYDLNMEENGENLQIGSKLIEAKVGENEGVKLSYDLTVNGASVGLSVVVEGNDKGAVAHLMMSVGEDSMEMATVTVTNEPAEPSIAFVEGGETVAPLKLSSEEFGKFMEEAAKHIEAASAQMGEKISAVVEPIIASLMPAEE